MTKGFESVGSGLLTAGTVDGAASKDAAPEMIAGRGMDI
jgi:hypothetical protein